MECKFSARLIAMFWTALCSFYREGAETFNVFLLCLYIFYNVIKICQWSFVGLSSFYLQNIYKLFICLIGSTFNGCLPSDSFSNVFLYIFLLSSIRYYHISMQNIINNNHFSQTPWLPICLSKSSAFVTTCNFAFAYLNTC